MLTCGSRAWYIFNFVSPQARTVLAHLEECSNRFFEFLLSRTNLSLHEIRLDCASRTAYSSHHALSGTTVHSFIRQSVSRRQRHVDECFVTPNWAGHNAFTFFSMSCHVQQRPPRELIFLTRVLRFIGRPYNRHKSHVQNNRADLAKYLD